MIGQGTSLSSCLCFIRLPATLKSHINETLYKHNEITCMGEMILKGTEATNHHYIHSANDLLELSF